MFVRSTISGLVTMCMSWTNELVLSVGFVMLNAVNVCTTLSR